MLPSTTWPTTSVATCGSHNIIQVPIGSSPKDLGGKWWRSDFSSIELFSSPNWTFFVIILLSSGPNSASLIATCCTDGTIFPANDKSKALSPKISTESFVARCCGSVRIFSLKGRVQPADFGLVMMPRYYGLVFPPCFFPSLHTPKIRNGQITNEDCSLLNEPRVPPSCRLSYLA